MGRFSHVIFANPSVGDCPIIGDKKRAESINGTTLMFLLYHSLVNTHIVVLPSDKSRRTAFIFFPLHLPSNNPIP
jgi:hypothetical protein